MYISNALKNEKSYKNKKMHRNIVMCQVKNKNIINSIDEQRQLNKTTFNPQQIKKITSRNLMRLGIKSKQQISMQLKQRRSHILKTTKEKQNIIKAKDNSNSTIQVIKKKTLKQGKRKSSRIQLQLKDIIKYSEMFPSRKKSIEYMNNSISKFINQSANTSRKSSIHKNKIPFCENQTTNKQNKFQCVKKSNFIQKNQLCSETARKQNLQKIQKYKNNYLTIPDEDFHINFLQNSHSNYGLINQNITQQQKEQILQKDINKKRIKHILTKSKRMCNQNKFSYQNISLDKLIQEQACQLSEQKIRKTVNLRNQNNTFCLKYESSPKRNQNNDFRLENQIITYFHKLISGGMETQSEEFSDYISKRQIKKYRQKFDIYDKLYKNIVQSLQAKKNNFKDLTKQDLKSIFFLDWSSRQSNTFENKKAIKQAMRRIRVLQ